MAKFVLQKNPPTAEVGGGWACQGRENIQGGKGCQVRDGEGVGCREARTFREHLGVRANKAGVRGREEGVRVIPAGWEKRIRNWFCVFSRGG